MYDTLGTVPKSNKKKPVERGKIDTNNTQVYDLQLSWLGTGTSIKSGGVKQVTQAQTSPSWAQTSPHGLKPPLMGLMIYCSQASVFHLSVKCQKLTYSRRTALYSTLLSGALESIPGYQWGSCYTILCFMCIFCRSLFVLFLLTIVLSVFLRFTNSDYSFCIFKHFQCIIYLIFVTQKLSSVY